MKILLVLPEARINKLHIGNLINISFREAPLTATHLAALVPKSLNAEIKIIDESVGQNIPFNESFDLVGISILTGTSNRGYEIADFFMKKGITVIIGGVHATLMPEEASKHCHSLVIGFAEQTWIKLLNDFSTNKLQKQYVDFNEDISNLPVPRRDLQKKFGYLIPNNVFVTRGCKNSCNFCSVPAAKFGWKKRPINDVINEIKQIKAKRFAIDDVHLTNDPDYAKEFFKALIPLKKKWGALASVNIVKDLELIELMRQSGCTYLLIGIESINQNSLSETNKKFNNTDKYKNMVNILHENKISIQGCFIFGFDNDDKNVFNNTVDYVNEIKIDIPRYAVYTPYPGTKLFKKLEKENRLLHKNWYYYDTQHVVFKPKNMTPQELDAGFIKAYNDTFKIKSNFKRAVNSGNTFLIAFFGNLAYKLYLKRLNNDNNRFPNEVKL